MFTLGRRTFIPIFLLWCFTYTGFGQVFVSIEGTISLRDGSVVSNAAVTATNVTTNQTWTVTTTSEGVYRFKNLPPGQYRITVSASGFKPPTRLFEANPGQTSILNIVLDDPANIDQSSLLNGKIKDRRGRAIMGSNLILLGSNNRIIKQTSTDASGNFSLTIEIAGQYMVEVNALGYKPQKNTIRSKSGTIKVLNFTLKEKN